MRRKGGVYQSGSLQQVQTQIMETCKDLDDNKDTIANGRLYLMEGFG